MNHQDPGELSIESLFSGRGPLDFNSSAFKASPELRELQERFIKAKSEKQSMSIMGSCLAMASPIMPLGFLATLFLLGKMDGMDKDPFALEMGGNKTLKGEMARIAAAEALLRKRKENGEDPETNAYLKYASRELAMRPYKSALRPLRANEKRVIPNKQSRENLGSNSFFITKEKQAKMREIKKQKILLESIGQKEREEQNLAEASQISQKLELLDKLLNKIEKS